MTNSKAFPVVCGTNPLHKGMDLRDYFAAAALTGFIARTTLIEDNYAKKAARISYTIADAMMERRNA